MKTFIAFVGGALIGAATALLLAPESGDETRAKVRSVLKKYGILPDEESEEILDQIVAEIETSAKK